MAVTTEGMRVRCWTFPDNTSDQVIIKKITGDLAAWKLNRVVWVADRGFNSIANRAYLQHGGGHCHYVVAERLHHASSEAKEALSRPGRYHRAAGSLEVKEVRVAQRSSTTPGQAGILRALELAGLGCGKRLAIFPDRWQSRRHQSTRMALGRWRGAPWSGIARVEDATSGVFVPIGQEEQAPRYRAVPALGDRPGHAWPAWQRPRPWWHCPPG